MIAHALVHTFVVSAKDDDVLLERETVGCFLVKTFAVRCREDDLVILPFGFQMRDQTVNRLYLKHHPCSETKGVVIHLAVFVQRPIPQIMHVYLTKTFGLCALYDGVVQR